MLASVSWLTACGALIHIPERPLTLPGALSPEDTGAVLARQLAPTLYLVKGESFPLARVVAVVHPTRPVIAYYLLYQHDLAARWSPFGGAPDEEEVWVQYDSTHAPTDLWTYWHGTILHTDWRGKGQVLVDVQWGKHGSLPHNAVPSDLPAVKSLKVFYAMTWFFPDLLLGRLESRGPLCYCHSYDRYREFTEPLPLGPRLDAIVRTDDPDPALTTVFGADYARKKFWPWAQRRLVFADGADLSGGEALLASRAPARPAKGTPATSAVSASAGRGSP